MRKTIKDQILFGYLLLVLVPICMTVITIFYLTTINRDLTVTTNYRGHQSATKDAVVGHYSWIMGLGDTIVDGVEFKGGLDPTACGLGKWMASVGAEDLNDPTIAAAMENLKNPHNQIHTSASALVELSKVDQPKAYEQYVNDIKPKVSEIIADIQIITGRYGEIADKAASDLKGSIVRLIFTCLGLIVIAVVLSAYIGLRIAKRISHPITEAAKWAKSLAIGCDTLDFSSVDINQFHPKNEVAIMLNAFEGMATSVSGNVAVVKRVADGDLTAFVDIRSEHDSLGQNLYRMVQTNDLMFAEILDVASHVAANANEISKASGYLASSTTEQAAAVQELDATVAKVRSITIENSGKVTNMKNTFEGIQTDVIHSTEQMSMLVAAVEEIRAASDKISKVIKTIDDISFQTNILALNAAIEAARAGEAGKGFAVVADEVRELALKSSNAADETKELIENTISKTHYGAKVAKETNETFAKITDNIIKTVDIIDGIAIASKQQESEIGYVYNNIGEISKIASGNASSSEQSSAASEQMRHSADILREQMSHFNLRQRERGKPYIPKEKQNDSEFIRIANENYNRALELGITSEERLLLK